MKDLNRTKIFFKENDGELEKEFLKSRKDSDFDTYLKAIRLPNDTLMHYTSRLENSFNEFKNCSTCQKLSDCKNEVIGFCLTPIENNGGLKFEYKACRYKQKEIEANKESQNVYVFELPKEIKKAKMKDIFLDDKNRKEAITWLMDFVKTYNLKNKTKGLYLNGNFGCGKTFLIAAAFNELSKKGINSAIIYWPEFLRSLKESFDDDFKDKFNNIKRVPLLLIDDIGAENVTAWGRDEILGTILQYRMEEGLTTFFTSNLSYEELESALSLSKQRVDSLKATRIIERIKNLTVNMTIVGENKRK